ncbi:hypothetical protein halTADL_0876 [Halohasta litchfieldiae]|jgi:hypothetical protein|uniref:DUF5305 domain-containing protein n=1 Tax=Halohasta litchfieldiae TaxID=1073996 RepID=A0A1H6TJ15_9EURY|nr:DUF5305 family protein [Halohasta litchfieldiae]ATW87672.1 hypothetical protein halTADL_0876 [Halohasta litchfieldiae]SEI76215.1 hypothetical protein SAMN05444271_107106 [Halohasta litchfieldiae]
MNARLKLLVAKNGLVLAAVCVVVGLLLFAGAGQVYTSPAVVQPEPQEVDRFDIDLRLSETAVVQTENPLYEQGTRIQKPVYFANITPELTLSVVVDTNSDRDVDIDQRLVLSERATRSGSELWSRERVVTTNEETITDGRSRTNITLDVNSLAENQQDVAEIISSVSSINTQLRLETSYETEPVNGESYAGQLQLSLTPSSTDNAYWLSGSRSDSDTETRLSQPDPVQQPPNYVRVLLLVLGGCGMLGLGGVVVVKSRGLDPQELQIEVYNEEYSEWISKGELVVDPDRQYVYVNSLGDLVDIGIDADKRVIHDTDLKAFVVVDNDLIYYFAREPTNIELWANVGSSSETDQR